ncbi:MAG: hypothetical protein RL186_1278 [Pseudomonadota bacterium]
MSRRKKGQDVHGWIVLDKGLHLTSTDAVSRVRRAFDAKKAGHAGTLDPLATGILPIALGEATKTVAWLMEAQKAYRRCKALSVRSIRCRRFIQRSKLRANAPMIWPAMARRP